MPDLKNDLSVTVTDGGTPLEGVAITVSPGTATAMTDATGKATLNLDIGSYFVTFEADGYIETTIPVAISMTGPTNAQVSLSPDLSVGAPTLVTTDNLLAGFDAAVDLQVSATGEGPFTYEWTQLYGPEVTLTGADTDTLSFTTQAFDEAIGESAHEYARFGVLGIHPDAAGNYVFEVKVTDSDGRISTTEVVVNATRPTTGLRMVPVGVPVWLQGDGAMISATQTTWNWTLDKTNAAGSTATLTNATSQFPSFVPDIVGTYVLAETVSGKTMTIYSGTWAGSMMEDGSIPSGTCGICHGNLPNAPDKWTPFKDTRHFAGLADKLDGVTTQYFAEECLSCHTAGYDKTASNGGFDDLEATSAWSFPATLEDGNWSELVNDPTLGKLAGIQCENCHGPQLGPNNGPHTSSVGANPDVEARVSWASEVCASCHQEKPYHYKPTQWTEGGHDNLELAIGEGSVEKNANNLAHCGRCHSAQGFGRYADQLAQGYNGYLTSDGNPLDPAGVTNHKATGAELSAIGMNLAEVQAQTCATCHDPHEGDNPGQLRVYDQVTVLPSGMIGVDGMGTGALCSTCHNSRNAEHTDIVQNTNDINGNFIPLPGLTSFGGPHASCQSDMVFGFNAYFMPRYNPSAHLAVKDTCAGCHVNIPTNEQLARGETTNHSFVADNSICASCHTDNVDGEALQSFNQLALNSVRQLWAQKTLTTIQAAVNYLPPTGTMDVALRAYDPVTNLYSTSSSTVNTGTTGMVHLTPANLPSKVDAYYTATGTLLLAITVPNAVTFQPLSSTGVATGSPVTTNVLYTNAATLVTNQAVPTQLPWWTATAKYTVFSVPAPASGTVTTSYPSLPAPPPWANYNNVQTLMKAYWNFSLLNSDQTRGIHNPAFFTNVIAATNARLLALP